MATALALKYLFGAQLHDGTEVLQQDDDVCPTDPRRTAFWDLLQKDADGNAVAHPSGGFCETRSDIALFLLEAEDGTRYAVDLRDGHFEIQVPRGRGYTSRAFWIAEPPVKQELRLFYFRRRRQHATATMTVRGKGDPAYADVHDAGQECEYHFGWQTLDRQHKAEMILL